MTELDEPHHTERAISIGIAHGKGNIELNIPIGGTVLHLKLNRTQARWLGTQLLQVVDDE